MDLAVRGCAVHWRLGAIGFVLFALLGALVPLPPSNLTLARTLDLLPVFDSGRLPPMRVPPAPIPRLVREPAQRPLESTIQPITELEWLSASAGRPALTDPSDPIVGRSFTGGQMVVAGEAFLRGIGTYPFSEIAYELTGRGLRFTTRVGVTDDGANRVGSVRFFVYGDEFLLYESEVVRAGQTAHNVEVDIRGFSQLRLVVDDAGDGPARDFALWAEPLISLSSVADRVALGRIQAARSRQADVERVTRAAEYQGIRARRELDSSALERLGSSSPIAIGAFDDQTSALVLSNDQIAVVVGYGGQRNGRLTLLRRPDEFPILQDVSPTLETRDGLQLELAAQPADFPHQLHFERVNHPTHGSGIEATVTFAAPGAGGHIAVHITVFDGSSTFELRLSTDAIPLKSVQYFDPSWGGAFLGRSLRYVSEGPPFAAGTIHSDGHVRHAPIAANKSALVWSEASRAGLVLSTNHAISSPLWLSLRRHPGRSGTELGIELLAQVNDFGASGTAPPPLSVRLTNQSPGPRSLPR